MIPEIDWKQNGTSPASFNISLLQDFIPLTPYGELDQCRKLVSEANQSKTTGCDGLYVYDDTYYHSSRVIDVSHILSLITCTTTPFDPSKLIVIITDEFGLWQKMDQGYNSVGLYARSRCWSPGSRIAGGQVNLARNLNHIAERASVSVVVLNEFIQSQQWICRYGRKVIFYTSGILQLIAGLACAFVGNIYAYAAALFFYGMFGSGGSYIAGFVLSEYGLKFHRHPKIMKLLFASLVYICIYSTVHSNGIGGTKEKNIVWNWEQHCILGWDDARSLLGLFYIPSLASADDRGTSCGYFIGRWFVSLFLCICG